MDKIRITRADNTKEGISGTVAFEAPQGLIVTRGSSGSLAKATGTRGLLLERPVTADGSTLEDHIFSPTILTSVKVGEYASARPVTEIEVEGAGLVLASGTGAITSGTAAGTELSTNAGRLSVKQNGQEVVGWLREQLTVEDEANACRIRVEFAG